MLWEHSAKTTDLLQRLGAFFEQHIYPNEARHHDEMEAFRRAGNVWQPSPLVEELKPVARAAGPGAAPLDSGATRATSPPKHPSTLNRPASVNTVTKLLFDAGTACAKYQHDVMRNLPCRALQLDEI